MHEIYYLCIFCEYLAHFEHQKRAHIRSRNLLTPIVRSFILLPFYLYYDHGMQAVLGTRQSDKLNNT